MFQMLNSKFIWLALLMLTSFFMGWSNGQDLAAGKEVDIGVILDLDTPVGKICKTCISMALEDFYSNHKNYSIKIVPHFRDSSSDVVDAASAAVDLLKNTQVMAILGPQMSIQADFVINIGEKARVPIISPATSPALSPSRSQHFIRSSWCSSSQAKAIAAIVKTFGWREVVLIYEDTNYGSGLEPFLTEDLLKSNALVSWQSVVSPSARNEQILEELYKLKTMQTRVFVVHMLPTLASRFFRMASKAEMMARGYAWLITDVVTSLLDSVDSETIEAMQGVLGVKASIPRSNELTSFTKRWSRRFHQENPDMDITKLNVFGLWAYDSITALADAIGRVGATSPRFKKPDHGENLTDLEAIGISNTGPSFVHLIRNFTSKGLSGNFNIINGELQPSTFEIVNVIGKGENTVGFWTEKYGIAKQVKPDNQKAILDNLGGILWPGQTSNVPKGWETPTSGKKLKVIVPVRNGFNEYTKIERNAVTNGIQAVGFCIDVFKQVMASMSYAVPYDLIPLELPNGLSIENFNDLAKNMSTGDLKYDAVVGDVTITAERSEYIDFTFPFTESGVATIVPIKDNERKSAWIFLKPMTTGLWLTIVAFFVFTGFVVWVLEHRVNKTLRGPPLQQVGIMFWFSISTLVFAQSEKVISNLTRLVLIVWVFVVLVLTSSYTASLTSMLTVQQLQPTTTDINDLIKRGEYIGYQRGSFVRELLEKMEFDNSMLRNYSTVEEYDEALSKGSRNRGVAAIVDELPYIRLFLSKYCHKYTMIGPTYPTSGFGFVFAKGSPLVADVSKAILKLKEGEEMVRISRKWFKEDCSTSDGDGDGAITISESLDVDSFKGLFLIAGLSSVAALAVFLSIFLYENRFVLTSTASIKQKLYLLSSVFYHAENQDTASSKVSISFDEQGTFSQDDGSSTAHEPSSPTRHAIEVIQ